MRGLSHTRKVLAKACPILRVGLVSVSKAPADPGRGWLPPGTLLSKALLTRFLELAEQHLIPGQTEELGAKGYSVSGQVLE